MIFWQRRRDQSGDTIVEVLIAIAVVSSVLTGAFIVSQKSAMAVRDSQEHGEMLQVLQGQVELVRSMALNETDISAGIYDTSPLYFCIDASNPAAPKRVNFTGPLPGLAADTFNYDVAKKCNNIQGRYNVAVSYGGNPDTGGSGVFNFVGRWDGIQGVKNEERLSYRVYPATAP